MYQNFDDEKKEKASRNPFNRHILKGGQVDPGSKLYQRSVAGREKLDTMLQRLWDQGADEADVFMAGVKALTSRDKGYVGAYLDSNNPGRRYQDNEAKAITDQVMSDLGIGEHPGARLTRPKDSEGKEERKTSNQIRGTFGPSRPEGEAPRKAMPVGQQRKLGKRSSTGQPVEDSSRPSQEEERQKRQEGRQDYYYTDTNVQRKFMDIMKDGTRKIQERVDSGQITKEQAAKEMSKLKDQALTQAGKEDDEKRRSRGDLTPAEQEQADKKQQRVDEMRQRIAEQKGLRDREAAAPGPGEDEEFRPVADPTTIRGKFKKLYEKATERTGRTLKDHVKKMSGTGAFVTDVQEIIGELEENFNVDPDEFKKAVASSFGINLDNHPGWDSTIKSGGQKQEAPGTAPGEEQAAPEEPKPQPQPISDPWEGETSGPAKDVTQEQAPVQQQTPTRALPPARSPRPVTSKGGFRAGKQPTRKKPRGFGGTPNPKTVKEIIDVAKEKPPIEDFKKFLYNKQGELFGGAGSETLSADTNPLEGGSTQPFPEGPEETAPASQLPGGGGPTPPTAKAGQPGQQGLFRSGTYTPRTGSGFGSKPKPPAPQKPVETEQDRANRMKELMDSGMSTNAALNQMKKEGSVTPRTEGGKGRSRKKPTKVANRPKKRPILDNIARGINNLAGGNLFSEPNMSYEEFAQSVRAIMR